jgi:hypothetical protein
MIQGKRHHWVLYGLLVFAVPLAPLGHFLPGGVPDETHFCPLLAERPATCSGQEICDDSGCHRRLPRWGEGEKAEVLTADTVDGVEIHEPVPPNRTEESM